ncbi:MAG: cyclase family protein [Candidatus Eisenbacteria bacterium]|nr:cyclase family protein [Candidatus Eisenbacteria bacterium]
MPQWPGDPPVRLRRALQLGKGDGVNLTALEMCAHAGTHIDAPLHFIASGADASDVRLDVLVGRAFVVDMAGCPLVDAARLERAGIPHEASRILLRTNNSIRGLLEATTFHDDFVGVSPDGAGWLIGRGIRLVGIDYLSIGPHEGGEETHRMLLQAGIVVVEGLVLAHVAPGAYQVVCLPLRLPGADGAPARVILVSGDMPS